MGGDPAGVLGRRAGCPGRSGGEGGSRRCAAAAVLSLHFCLGLSLLSSRRGLLHVSVFACSDGAQQPPFCHCRSISAVLSLPFGLCLSLPFLRSAAVLSLPFAAVSLARAACVCNHMCMSCTAVSQARPHKSG